MQVILFIFCLLFLLLNWSQVRDTLNPGFLFNLIWSVVSLLYILDYGGLYDVAETTYMVLFVGLVVYNIPTLVMNVNFKRQLNRYSRLRHDHFVAIERPMLHILFQIILILAMIPFMWKILAAAAGAGLGAARILFATNEGNLMSFWERWIYIYLLIYPGINVQMLITAFIVIKTDTSRRYKVLSFVLSIIAVLLRVVTDGGRMVMLDTVICILLALGFAIIGVRNSLSKMDKRVQKRLRRILLLLGSVFVLLIIIVTFQRSSGDVNPIEYALGMVSRYFTLGPRLLEKALENPRNFGLNDMTFGGVYIGGAWEYLQKICAMVGIEIPSFFGIAQQEMGQAYNVGQGIYMNAFPTMYYYFMKDWSYFGIFLGTLIFSISSFYLYCKMHRFSRFSGVCWYYLVTIGIIYSPCWWPFYRVEYFSILLLFMLCCKIIGLKWKSEN